MEIVLKAEPEDITIDTGRTAVIVVDMQNAFCKKGGMMDYRGNLNEPRVECVISACRKIIEAARKSKIPVFYLRMTYGLEVDANLGPESPFFWKEKGLETIRLNPEQKDRFLTAGAWGWDIIEELKPQPADVIVDKSRFSGFVNTNLDAALQAAGIKYLVFTGLYTNICVESTLRDAFFREYFPILIQDACGNMGPDLTQDSAIWNIQSVFGWVAAADDLIKSLK